MLVHQRVAYSRFEITIVYCLPANLPTLEYPESQPEVMNRLNTRLGFHLGVFSYLISFSTFQMELDELCIVQQMMNLSALLEAV